MLWTKRQATAWLRHGSNLTSDEEAALWNTVIVTQTFTSNVLNGTVYSVLIFLNIAIIGRCVYSSSRRLRREVHPVAAIRHIFAERAEDQIRLQRTLRAYNSMTTWLEEHQVSTVEADDATWSLCAR